MAGKWDVSDKLAGAPQRIRPETHWFQETIKQTKQGREDGRLWFSLWLTPERAQQLCDCFAGKLNEFAELINAKCKDSKERAVTMAPTSYAALCLAISEGGVEPAVPSDHDAKIDLVGTDILVHPDAFPALEALSKKGAIEVAEAGLAIAGDIKAPPPKRASRRSIPDKIPDKSPVIIAIIDDGVGIAHHRFRAAEKETRIKHFLDLALIGKPTATGAVDEPLARSWTGGDIDRLLARYPRDEEQIYRKLGLIDHTSELRQPLRAAVTHGTHMLDLAAGYDLKSKAEADEANQRPIIAVQLPTQVAENRSDTWLPQSLKRALDWILVKADELSAELSSDGKRRRLPLVVNGSFGSLAGPQDGFGDVERRITQFVKTYRGDGPEDLCTFVLSVGNALQLRAAARMDVCPEHIGEIPWRVLPDDKTPSFVQIWLPRVEHVCGNAPLQQVEVFLVPPRDMPENKLSSKLGEAIEWKIGNDVLARVYHQRFARPDGSRECITIAIRLTTDDQGGPVVPSGLWLIKIKNTTERVLHNIDLRVHRDDVGMFARTGARQSYFDHPEYERFDSSGRTINDERLDDQARDDKLRRYGSWTRVTRQGTLSTYACAEGVLAVGGYRRSDNQPAAYSSAGRVGGRTPDLAAISEESPAIPGVLAAGTYSGSVAILSGTSVAAPQVTRALADQIRKPDNAGRRQTPTPVEKPGPGQLIALAKQKAKVETVERRAEKVQRTAVATSGPGPESRALRYGVGRLPFTFRSSSYPKRIGE